jgi:hypothetical protein
MPQQSPRAGNRTSRAPSSKSVASRGQAAVPAAGRADSPRAIVRTVPERANAWATKEWPLGTVAGDSFATGLSQPNGLGGDPACPAGDAAVPARYFRASSPSARHCRTGGCPGRRIPAGQRKKCTSDAPRRSALPRAVTRVCAHAWAASVRARQHTRGDRNRRHARKSGAGSVLIPRGRQDTDLWKLSVSPLSSRSSRAPASSSR